MFKCSRERCSFHLGYAMLKETPQFEGGIGLVRAIEDCLVDVHVLRGGVGELPAGTRNIVCMSKMPIAIKDERRCREFFCEWIAGVHAKHQIRRVICSPRSRVGEIVLGIKGVISNQTAKDSTLYGESLSHWQEVLDIHLANLSQPISTAGIKRRSGKRENLGLF